jgi:putative ABC transport system permease protein
MKYAILILKNLARSKRRTLLTIFSIAVSFFVFSALVSLPSVANQLLTDVTSVDRIACHNKAGLAYFMPEAYRNKIAGMPHVVAVESESWFGGIYHDFSDQFPNEAVDPADLVKMWPDRGISPETYERFAKIRTACIVGHGTMSRFHLHVGQQIMLRGVGYPFNLTFQVVGVFGGNSPPDVLIFRRDYLEAALGQTPPILNYWVRVDDQKAAPQVSAAIEERFANSSAEVECQSEKTYIAGVLQMYKTVFRMTEALGLAVVIAIGLVAANTAAMSIRERWPEIAIMRSIGFSGRVIMSILLAESLIIALAGGLIGCGAAFVMLKVFSVGNLVVMEPIKMPPLILLEGLVAAALIGLLSAYIPARSAVRRSVAEALRLVD